MPDLAVAPALANTAPLQPAVLVVDDECRCIEASAAACRLLGIERDRVVGERFQGLVAAESRSRFGHVWNAFREGGGHAGPFTLAAPAPPAEIEISVTENLMPNRHLLMIIPAAGEPAAVAGPPEGGAAQFGPLPVRQPSAREREVLGLLAAGATDPQIAEMLELSPATVQTHVRNAKAKLGARTRAQAVAIALSRGLIDQG